MAKRKVTKKKILKVQKDTIKKMKETRQIDSKVLRDLIEQKLKWAIVERNKGLALIRQTQVEVTKLEGIVLFIKDLLDPIKKEEK